MQKLRLSTIILALSVVSAAGIASADDPNKSGAKTTEAQRDRAKQQKKQQQPMKSADVSHTQRSTEEVMKITQQAMTHVTAAQRAIARDDTAAAKKALQQSEQALGKLYDAPPMATVLNELDEAIATAQQDQRALEVMDLAPLRATVRRYQAYVDPSVAAGIEEAAAKAEQGDAQAAADALRLARNRVALDVAFVPVEEAYVRVLAAQQALATGDKKQARTFLQNVPIVVSELQISTPLVPVRFKLNAAALAAEEGNWKRSQMLVQEATNDLQSIERISKKTENKKLASEVSALVDDLKQLNSRMAGETRPQPQQIRAIAQRTREVGEIQEQDLGA